MASWVVGAVKLLLALQAAAATVVGTVRDGESGEPLAGAVVALPDVGRTAVSDAEGRYVLREVPPGPQHVTVRRIGFAPRTLHALVPREGELEINIALRTAPVTLRAVEVRPAVTVRGVDSGDSASFPDRGISAAAIRNHPLLAEPDALLALGGGDVVVHPETPSGMHLRGGASDQTAYVLDGIPVLSPYHAAGTFSAWNPDALERVQVSSAAPSPTLPDALSGVVAAATRAPDSRFQAQGSLSTTQARATVDGPLGVAGGGYLVSARSGFPDVIAPEEASYLAGETADLLAKVEASALGGHVRLLGYDSENELDAAAVAEGAEATPPDLRRNAYAWRSRSLGAEWLRRAGGVAVRLRGWRASGGADASWHADGASSVSMAAERRDDGLLAVVERRASTTTTAVGVRVGRNRTSYRVTPDARDAPSLSLSARTPVVAPFVQHERPLGRRLAATVALSAAAVSGNVYAGPQAQLRWSAAPPLTVVGAYARSHQFWQSLRNPESFVGNVFPADLYVGAGAGGVPVARSDGGVLAAEYRPRGGMRLGAQAFLRDFHGLVLVAPRTGEPFGAGAFAVGSGRAGGFSLDGAVSGARYGLVASYGWQRVRVDTGGGRYVPDYGAGHVMEAGLILFPSATSSIRVGATGAAGRRSTPVSGAVEWESCNLQDEGCEFGGSPRGDAGHLGAARLPPYLRLDVGLRKHWHLDLAGRDAVVALFGTVTNVLARKNVLAVATDPATGARTEIGMRPRAPLVVGLDWWF